MKSKRDIHIPQDKLEHLVSLIHIHPGNKRSKNDIRRIMKDGGIKFLGEDEDWIIRVGDQENTFEDPIDQWDFDHFITFLDTKKQKLFGCFKVGKKDMIWI